MPLERRAAVGRDVDVVFRERERLRQQIADARLVVDDEDARRAPLPARGRGAQARRAGARAPPRGRWLSSQASMSRLRNRHCRPTRTAGILPALISRYTVRRLTWRYSRTSSVVRNVSSIMLQRPGDGATRQLDGEHGAALRMVRGDDLAAVLLHDAVGDAPARGRCPCRLPSSCRTARRCATACPRESRRRCRAPWRRSGRRTRDTNVAISMRPPCRRSRRSHAPAFITMFRNDLVQQQRVALHARQLLVIVSHDFDALRHGGRRAQRQHLLQDDVEADRAERQAPRAGEDQQVAHDFRGAVGFTID